MVLKAESIFDEVANYLIGNNIFNVYIFRLGHCQYFVYEICAFCESGKHILNYVMFWTHSSGFRKEFTYESSFKGTFFGANVKIGVVTDIPTFFVTGVAPNGDLIYTGQEYWLMKSISDFLDFNSIAKEPQDKIGCKFNGSGSSFTPIGFCKDLIDKEVQLAGFPYGYDYFDQYFFDFTSIYYQVTATIVSTNPPLKKHWSSMVSRLKPSTLLCLFISFLLVSLAVWIFTMFSNDKSNLTIGEILLKTYSILCLEGTGLTRLSSSSQIVFGIWMLSCFFAISTIFGEMTSVIVKPVPDSKIINNVEDMKKMDLSWVTIVAYNVDGFLQRELPELADRKKRMNVEDGLQYVLDHPKEYVYIWMKEVVEPWIRLKYWDGRSRNPFHLSPPVVGAQTYLLTVIVAKDAPWRNGITRKLLQIEAAGLFRGKYKPDMYALIGRMSDVKVNSETKVKAYSLKLENMIPIGILMAVFFVVASVIFFGELCVWKLKNKSHK